MLPNIPTFGILNSCNWSKSVEKQIMSDSEQAAAHRANSQQLKISVP